MMVIQRYIERCLWLPAVCGLAGLLGLVGLSGCTSWNLTAALPWSDSTPKPQTPTRMTDIWTDTVLYQPGLPAVRGFGGRVMFYGDDANKPVPVDGTFIVLAFDDTQSNPQQTLPEKKFIILPEQLPSHYSRSELGHSYSFWLPWDELAGEERRVCLVARFEPRKGKPVISQPSHHVLPGEKARKETSATAVPALGGPARAVPHGLVQQASYEQPAPHQESGEARMATLTMDVPPSFARPGVSSGQESQREAPAPASPPSSRGQTSLIGDRSPGPSAPEKDSRAFDTVSRPQAQVGPSARSAPRRFPAQTTPAAPQGSDPVRRQPLPATWPSRLPPTPRSGPWGGSRATTPTEQATSQPRSAPTDE